jgi:hypothetical protein
VTEGVPEDVQYVPFERKSESQPRGSRWLVLGAAVVAVVIIGTIFVLLQGRADPTLPVTQTVGASGSATDPAAAGATAQQPSTLPPTQTPEPTATPTELPTDTPLPVPTQTTEPTALPQNFVPSPTPLPSVTATPTEEPTRRPLLPTVPLILSATPLGAGSVPGTAVPGGTSGTLPTAVPEAATGDYDLLADLDRLGGDQITWNVEWFSKGSRGWQLGNATARTGQAAPIRIGPDILTPLYGTEAAAFVKRVDATMELVSYNEVLLNQGQIGVYFGLGLETVRGARQRADVRARLSTPNVLTVGSTINGGFRKKTDIPVTTVSVRLSVERNADRTLSLYVDGQLVGTSPANFALETPLTVYFYTSTGGVVVSITSLRVRIER